MKKGLFRKKIMTSVILFFFTSSFSVQALPQNSVSEQSEVQKLMRAGKELYENGEYKEATAMFLTILTKAKSVDELTEVYFNLSLTFFANAQSKKAEEYLQKLFEIWPDKTIDERYFPLGFVELYNRLRPELQTKTEPKMKPKLKTEPERKKELKPETKLESKTKTESKIKPEPKRKKEEQKDTPQPVKEGDLVPLGLVDIPPEPIKKIFPVYPIVAMRLNIRGTVIVNALISEKGDVISTAILKGVNGSFRLNEAAQKAVRKWKFKPAYKDSKAVKVWKPITIKFTEKKNQSVITSFN
jgi:protein TonB